MADPKEYITWVGSDTTVGTDLYVGWAPRSQTTNGVVHSPNRSEWRQVTDPEALAIVSMSEAQSNAILEMVSARGGTVRYYDGAGYPPLRGFAAGDLARGRDSDNTILVEYRWTGLTWEKTSLSSGTISNLDVGKLTAGAADVQRVAAEKIWSRIVQADVIQGNKISGDMIAANSITAESGVIQSLDIGKATVGVLNPDRVAAGSITAAKLAAGTITADSGVVGSLSANVLTTGVLDAARVNADTLRGKTLDAGIITGGTITGSVFRTAASGDRVEIDTANGVRIINGGSVVAHLSPVVDTGLALRSPTTGQLTPVSSVIFGPQYAAQPAASAAASNGWAVARFTFQGVPSGRAIVNVSFTILTQANTAGWREFYFSATNPAGTLAEIRRTGRRFSNAGWMSDSVSFSVLASSVRTSGTWQFEAWTYLGDASGASGQTPFTAFTVADGFATAMAC